MKKTIRVAKLLIRKKLKLLRKLLSPEVQIRHIVLSVGQACNLSCIECGALTPYAPKEIMRYEMEAIIKDLELFIKNGFVFRRIQIQGGEPLLYKRLPELLKWLYESKKFENIRIATNGTLIPGDEILTALKSYNVQMRISDYHIEENKAVIPELINILETHAVRYYYYSFKSGESLWYAKGGLEMEREADDATVKKRFQTCKNNTCLTLENAKLCWCTRAINAPLIQGFDAKGGDFLRVADSRALRYKILMYLEKKRFMEACRYCRGTDEAYLVPPAEQMRQEVRDG